MRKSFVQNIIFLILVNLIVKPFWVLGIDRTVQNTVGHEQYGLYQALFNVTILFQILLDFGLQSYNTKIISKSPKAISNLLPNIVVVKLLFSLLYIGILLIFGAAMGYDNNAFMLLFILIAMQIVSSFLLFFRSNISALQYFKIDSIFSVADRVIAIIILGIILFGGLSLFSPFQIEWYALVQLFAFAIAALAAFWTCLKLGKNINWKHIKLKKIRIVILQSLPYAALIFFMAIYTRSDTIILEKISNDASLAGKYAAAYRILDVFNNMTGVLIAGLLLPLFGKLIAQKEDFKGILDICTKLIIPFSLVVSIITLFWSIDILHLMKYKDINQNDAITLQWLIACFPLYCINYIYATLLTANGNIKTLIYISLIAFLTNISLNLCLMEADSALNAVIASKNAFITLCIVSSLNLYFSFNILKMKINTKSILQLLLFAAILLGTTYVLYTYTHLSLYLNILIICIIALMFFLSIGFIPLKTIKEQLKLFSKAN